MSFFHSTIWNKVNPGLGWRYRRQHEMIMVAHRAGGKLAWAEDSRAVPNIISMSPPRNRAHPNEKPKALVEMFIINHTLPGQVVLDPFMGSGTTLVAAMGLGRPSIGIEIDPDHYETALRRVEEAHRSPSMFVAPPPKPVQETML